MYTLNIENERLFDERNYYKLKCIGKCTKGFDPSFFRAKYFLTCHDKNYVAYERLNTLDDIKVDVVEVENFEVPEDYDQYMLFAGIEENPIKERIANEVGNAVLKFRGFYLFRQMYYTSTGCAMGGIDDSFKYENVNLRKFKKEVKEKQM